MAKEVGTRPKSAGLEAPVLQEMQAAGMIGELRDEATLGLRSVPRPPMVRMPMVESQSSSAEAPAPIQVQVAEDSPGRVSVHSSTSSST